MGFRSVARFKCDGCKVIESDDVESLSDMMGAAVPPGWLRVETNKLTRDLNIVKVAFFCPSCSRLVESYLEGRRERGDA